MLILYSCKDTSIIKKCLLVYKVFKYTIHTFVPKKHIISLHSFGHWLTNEHLKEIDIHVTASTSNFNAIITQHYFFVSVNTQQGAATKLLVLYGAGEYFPLFSSYFLYSATPSLFRPVLVINQNSIPPGTHKITICDIK